MTPRTGWKDLSLRVPVVRQVNWCSCGLAALIMAMRRQGVDVTERSIESHPLVGRAFLMRYGFGPGRLGRIALAHGLKATIIDPEEAVVGSRFLAEGGRWIRRAPTRRDLYRALRRGIAPVACIPNKREAFEGSNSAGSHWVTIHAVRRGEFLIHDPAPWRKATRCKPGYWARWNCSALLVSR